MLFFLARLGGLHFFCVRGNGPDKTEQLAGDGRHDLVLVLTLGPQRLVALVQGMRTAIPCQALGSQRAGVSEARSETLR